MNSRRTLQKSTRTAPGAAPPIPLPPKGSIGPKPASAVNPQWAMRREGYARLDSRYKRRRFRDRTDVSGAPNMRRYTKAEPSLPKSNVAQRFAQRIREDMPKFQSTDFPLMAPSIAAKFAGELERATVAGITEEMDKALDIIRSRAEKQLGEGIGETRAEQAYLTALKAYVVKQIQKSAIKWRDDLTVAMKKVKADEVWSLLVDKEFEAKNDATVAARTLLGNVYNSYMAWLMSRKTDGLFKWVNPMDKHTSDRCRKIVSRTSSGVTLDKLKEIVREESDKGWYKARSPLLPHPQCRSTFVLVRRV